MKILLVDDEYYILNGLCKLIYSHFPELEIFTADNLTKEKEVLYEEKPDILITDIRITEDNGLDLLREAIHDFKNMHIYVISGYSEFEYARTAIELKVKDYILKPINQRKIIEVVQQSIKEIAEQKMREENHVRMIELAQKKMISNMISQGGASKEMLEELHYLEMDNLFKKYQVINISIKEYWMINTYNESVQLFNLKMFIQEKLNSLIKLSEAHNYLFVEGMSGNYILLIDIHYKALHDLLRNIYQAFLKEFKLYTDFQVSNTYYDAEQFFKAYCEIQKIIPDTSRILFYNTDEGKAICELERIRNEAVSYMKSEDYFQLSSMIKLILPLFFKTYRENPVVQSFAKELYKELISYILLKKGHMKHLFTEQTDESLEQSYMRLADELQFFQKEIIFQKNQKMIGDVLNYMDENISNVTLDNASDFAGTTSFYLSIIFKEVTGVNFKECLIQKKMNKACELLLHTNLHVYEISERIGYSDTKYFSKIFKRFTGLGPVEYRKQQNEKED